EGDRADDVVAEVLRDLEDELLRLRALAEGDGRLERVVDTGDRLVRELDVDDGTGHSGDAADGAGLRGRVVLRCGGSHSVFLVPWICVSGRERVGTADDLGDLLGDFGLAGVVGQ